jgi:hypothetical protein
MKTFYFAKDFSGIAVAELPVFKLPLSALRKHRNHSVPFGFKIKRDGIDKKLMKKLIMHMLKMIIN